MKLTYYVVGAKIFIDQLFGYYFKNNIILQLKLKIKLIYVPSFYKSFMHAYIKIPS